MKNHYDIEDIKTKAAAIRKDIVLMLKTAKGHLGLR